MSTLAVYQLQANKTWASGCPNGATATAPCKAQFNGSANTQDITNPLAPVSITSNNPLQFSKYD